MTAADWDACRDPVAMLALLRGRPTGPEPVNGATSDWRLDPVVGGPDRRFRLFACGCCRRVWGRLPDDRNRHLVAAVEGFVDGRAAAAELHAAAVASSAAEWLADGSGRRPEPEYWAVKALGRGFYKMTPGASALLVAAQVAFAADPGYAADAARAFHGAYYSGMGYFLAPFRWPEPVPPAARAELDAQADLVRCVFGNPLARPGFDPGWRTSAAVGLAAAMYEAREFAIAPVLADALQDAGCEDERVLGHLRRPGPHARGCWVVDLVLGKEPA